MTILRSNRTRTYIKPTQKKGFGNGFVDFSLQNTNLLLACIPPRDTSRHRIISNRVPFVMPMSSIRSDNRYVTHDYNFSYWCLHLKPHSELAIIPNKPRRSPLIHCELRWLLAYPHCYPRKTVSTNCVSQQIYPCHQVYLRTISRPVISMK